MGDLPTNPPEAPVALAASLAYCTFSDGGVISHWITKLPEGVYETLPNLFVVSIMSDVPSGRVVVGCSLFSIDVAQNDPEFQQHLLDILENIPELSVLLGDRPRVICTQLIKPEQPLSERAAVRLFVDEFTKRGRSGTA